MTALSPDTKRYLITCHKDKTSTFSFKISQKEVLSLLLLKTDALFAKIETAQEGGGSLYIKDTKIYFPLAVVLQLILRRNMG